MDVFLDDGDVGDQDDVHHQGIDDGRDGYHVVVEHQRAARDGDGLGGVLHPHLDDDGAPFFSREVHGAAQQCPAAHGKQNEYADGQPQLTEAVDDGGAVLEEKHGRQENQGREGDA